MAVELLQGVLSCPGEGVGGARAGLLHRQAPGPAAGHSQKAGRTYDGVMENEDSEGIVQPHALSAGYFAPRPDSIVHEGHVKTEQMAREKTDAQKVRRVLCGLRGFHLCSRALSARLCKDFRQ